jgi:hypothetical protein
VDGLTVTRARAVSDYKQPYALATVGQEKRFLQALRTLRKVPRTWSAIQSRVLAFHIAKLLTFLRPQSFLVSCSISFPP